MPDNPNIISTEAHTERRRETPIVRRANYALAQGGAVDIYTYQGGAVAAVVREPEKLKANQVKEIEAILAKVTTQKKAS